MAMYFRPVLGDRNGLKCVVFSRVVDGVMEFGKVFEHAWWNNPFCNAVSERLYKNPSRLCWVGDFVDSNDFDIPISQDASPAYIPSFKEIWGEVVRPVDLKSVDFTLDNKVLVNHDTKRYIDLNQYKRDSVSINDLVSHPIPLLTLIANEWIWIGFYINKDDRDKFRDLGSWAWCVISIEDEPPEGYSQYKSNFPIMTDYPDEYLNLE